jgi:hypothetical protein
VFSAPSLDRPGVADIHALAADPFAPGFAPPLVGELALARDDDLNTSVGCTPVEDRPCGIGLRFPGPVQLRAVRLWAAAGPEWRRTLGHPRPHRVRVHTDAGFFDGELEDLAGFQWVWLDPPVSTTTLAVEVLSVHPGRDDPELSFADLEAFGPQGPGREPLELDPAAAVFVFEGERWKHTQSDTGGRFVARPSFLELLQPDGTGRRVAPATAIHGAAGDRFLLLADLRATDCRTHEGRFVLLDRQTRVHFDVGDLGGLERPVRRHEQGLGFLGGDPFAPMFPVAGVVARDGVAARLELPRDPPTDPKATLAGWGFSAPPVGSESVAGCRAATGADLARLPAEVRRSVRDAGVAPTQVERWRSCVAADHTVLWSSASRCPEAWAAVVLGPGGAVTDHRTDRAGHVRAGRLPDGRLGLELSTQDGNQTTFAAVGPAGKLEEIGGGVGYALSMPAACRCPRE